MYWRDGKRLEGQFLDDEPKVYKDLYIARCAIDYN